MSDCQACPVEQDCHYPYKPCDCVHQRKFWSLGRRKRYDVEQDAKANPEKYRGQPLPMFLPNGDYVHQSTD